MFSNRLLPSLALLISLTFPSAALAAAAEDAITLPFELTVGEETQTLTLKELGVSVEKSKGMSAMIKQFFANVLLAESSPDFTWRKVLSEELIRDRFELGRPKNARFVQNNGVLSIEQETEGVSFDVDALLTEITVDYPDFESYRLKLTEANVASAEALITHFGQVNSLLGTGLEMEVGTESYFFPAQLKDIVVKKESDQVSISLNSPFVNYVTSTLKSLVSAEGSNLVIKNADPSKVSVLETEGHVKVGTEIDIGLTELRISAAASAGESRAIAGTTQADGRVVNESGHDLGPMQLIAEGYSNFENSPSGRDYNIRKALNEHFNSILIPPGETFKFNSFLGPVTNSAGWKNSLAIFGGNNLQSVPGGGICQVATTVYRAALDAGFTIRSRKNHSLYVHYYTIGGDGLDATIFPGSQDLTFVNNTGSYVLMEAYDDGYGAYVKLYGQSDGRNVTLDGPYTASNQTEEVTSAVGSLSISQIAWKQTITWGDGRTEMNWIKSSYRGKVTQY